MFARHCHRHRCRRPGALAVVLAAGMAAAAAGCRTPAGGGAPGTSAAAGPAPELSGGAPGFSVLRRAESVPIAAIAYRAPYLWAGTEHGLRRWNVQTEESEWIGASIGLLGRDVSALAIDSAGAVWVATDAGIGCITSAPSSSPSSPPALHYAPKGALAAVTSLAPTRDDGAWAGGPGGLYHLDGRGWAIVDFLRDVPVTSLDLDADGTSVWVGTAGHGLLRVGQNGGKPILSPAEAGDPQQIVGTAMSPGDVRVVAARAADGARVIFITKQGPEAYRTQPEAGIRAVRLLSAGGDVVLVAGPEGAERLYSLRPLARGEAPPPGGFRLIGMKEAAGNRYAAVPLPMIPPPDVTVVAASDGGGGDLWLGTRAMGVARAGKKGPVYLPGGELTGDADRMTVACTARDHCYVVAGGDHAWLFDGSRFREGRIGEVDGGRALAVATDHTGALYGVSSDPKLAGIVLTRLSGGQDPSQASKGNDAWKPLDRIPLGIPEGSPVVSFAAFAPDGRLWLGLGQLDAAGQEQGRGAVEIDLGAHKVIHHGAVGGKHPDPESLPLPHDLTGILFDGTATWFSARSGVSRWQESELRRWGENERMSSEVCYAVAKGLDGAVWAATSAGIGRFEGKQWRFADPDDPVAVPTRALARDAAGRMWLATSKGLRLMAAGDVSAKGLAPGQPVADGDMLDATLDRFGRVWVLGSSSLTLVDAAPDAARPR